MKIEKQLFTIILSIIGISIYAQHGITSGVGHSNDSENIYFAHTIGEAINTHTIDSEYSNKMGILQPLGELTSSLTKNELDINFNVFPNPTMHFIKVNYEGESHIPYKIYNILGEVLITGELSDKLIDLRILEQGTYFLLLLSDKGKITKTFHKF